MGASGAADFPLEAVCEGGTEERTTLQSLYLPSAALGTGVVYSRPWSIAFSRAGARERHWRVVAMPTIGILTQALKSSGVKHEDEVGLDALAEAWLKGDDLLRQTRRLTAA